MSSTQFEHIYFNQSRVSGKFRLADTGLGWKATEKSAGGSASATPSEPFLLASSELSSAYWSRAARGYELRFQTKNKGVIKLDGFDLQDFNELKNVLKHNYNVTLESREHSVKGWNWGKTDFARSELVFEVNNKPAFEIPFSDISNSNLINKSEVAVEFSAMPANHQRAGDELVEMRFFIPGTIAKEGEVKDVKRVKEEGASDGTVDGVVNAEDGDSNGEAEENQIEEQHAASVFYESLKEKAEIGAIAGEAIVTFSDILFLIPRGRYDIDMYPTSLRLSGKTYDYKIQYKNIQRLFLLPKPDEIHNLLIIQLDPPLRQGQTRYPFLLLQFLKEEEIEVELNLEDKEFEEKYADKLQKKYDQAAHQVVGQLFRGLTGRKIIAPGTYTSQHNQAGVSCSLKASEGYLYPLEKCFLFIPKPTVYIPLSEISVITFSRVGSAFASRTFGMTITLRGGAGEHQFSNINKEEQANLEAYIKSKGIKIKNDDVEEKVILSAVLADDSDDSDDDARPVRSDGEDDESPDEDFEDESESEVADEFDSNVEDSSEGEETDAPPAKKAKK
ncbi:SSrecog-domain-containing protein [Nadsonia fulvescens var. elongata DSM 6958]|uniref:FACT complex subunit POB3 n=1 Tax=Nadsonia fulvescens var. elongata DSM 6958 TaxID=857566 RepID=A0A1E3PL73_9ASCO|nr:SSrecog-domain-containing protein [Nadsonia fulvescens var. elongata DSM 6958]